MQASSSNHIRMRARDLDEEYCPWGDIIAAGLGSWCVGAIHHHVLEFGCALALILPDARCRRSPERERGERPIFMNSGPKNGGMHFCPGLRPIQNKNPVIGVWFIQGRRRR
jgi:hypothetical protein